VKELLEGGAMPMEVLKKRLGLQGDDGLELGTQLIALKSKVETPRNGLDR
jgi:hypothetical protein